MASNFGGLIQSVGAAWTMTSLGASPQMIALVQTSTTLPLMLLSLWAGAVADNLDRRWVMLWAQIFMLAVSVSLAVCGWLGVLNPWLILVFTFLLGCGTAVNNPAWQASVGDMVPRAALPSAVAMNSMGFNVARSLGPALGGVIVASFGAAAAFLTNAVSYLGLIAVLLRWRPEEIPRPLPRERIAHAMTAGVRYVSLSPVIRRVLVRAALFGLAASAVPALMPLVARDLLGGGPLVYGALLGAFGLGAVAGAAASTRLRQRLSSEAVIHIASAALIVGGAVSAFSHQLAITLPALVIAGSGWVLALSTFNVTVQISSPRWVVARALSLYQMFAFGGLAIGSWGFGLIAERQGVSTALLAASGAQALSMVVGLVLPLAKLTFVDLDPLGRFHEPETAISVEPRSGPIAVTIEYRIAPVNIVGFLAAMTERARIRRRDGAQHWTLLRDLGEPDLWVERYHVPTWLEYLRHNLRRTRADLANSELLHELHQGDEPPRVHRMIERQTSVLPWARGEDARELTAGMTDPTQSS
jgi:MFS family permease